MLEKIRDLVEWYLFSPADMGGCKLGRRSAPSVKWWAACMELIRNDRKARRSPVED